MGLASEQEARIVAEMVARYPEVKAELKAIEVALENFDKKNAVEPPAHLKEKILANIKPESKSASSPSNVIGLTDRLNDARTYGEVVPKQNNFYKYAAAIALIIILGGSIYTYRVTSESAQRIADLEENLRDANDDKDHMRNHMVESDSLLAELSGRVAILSAPGMKSIELKGMEVAPDSKAMVYANTTTGDSYLEIMNLPPAPEGMQYQFWGIVDDKPVDAGMIPLEGDLSGIHPMKNVPNTKAYAISLEPVGGSQQPTGKIYAMGNS